MALIGAIAQVAGAQPVPMSPAPGEPASEPAKPEPQPNVDGASRRHFNLRVGASAVADYERASICLEVAVWRKLTVEGCGNGSGFLHQGDGGELAHFRAKWGLWEDQVAKGTLVAQAGVGFAELQVGRDDPGFEFGDPTGASAAGAEGAFTMQYYAPVGSGFEFIASSAIGMAYIRGADKLPTAPSKNQPFASFELGIGW